MPIRPRLPAGVAALALAAAGCHAAAPQPAATDAAAERAEAVARRAEDEAARLEALADRLEAEAAERARR